MLNYHHNFSHETHCVENCECYALYCDIFTMVNATNYGKTVVGIASASPTRLRTHSQKPDAIGYLLAITAFSKKVKILRPLRSRPSARIYTRRKSSTLHSDDVLLAPPTNLHSHYVQWEEMSLFIFSAQSCIRNRLVLQLQ